jgi:hypothetical protein
VRLRCPSADRASLRRIGGNPDLAAALKMAFQSNARLTEPFCRLHEERIAPTSVQIYRKLPVSVFVSVTARNGDGVRRAVEFAVRLRFAKPIGTSRLQMKHHGVRARFRRKK